MLDNKYTMTAKYVRYSYNCPLKTYDQVISYVSASHSYDMVAFKAASGGADCTGSAIKASHVVKRAKATNLLIFNKKLLGICLRKQTYKTNNDCSKQVCNVVFGKVKSLS